MTQTVNVMKELSGVWIYCIATSVGILQALHLVYSPHFFYTFLFATIFLVFTLGYWLKTATDRWLIIGISILSFINTCTSVPPLSSQQQKPNTSYQVQIKQLLFDTGKYQRYLAIATPLTSTKAINFNFLDRCQNLRGNDISLQVVIKKKRQRIRNKYDFPAIKVGTSYLIKGRVIPILQSHLPINNFDYYLLSKNIFANLYPDRITSLNNIKQKNWHNKWFITICDNLNFKLNTIQWGNQLETNNFFYSILWGKKKKLDKGINSLFRELGLSHILVVSGFHIGLIFLFIHLIFSVFRPLVHSRLLFVIIQISILCIYAFIICGGSPSVTRATIMLCLAIVGLSYGRKITGYHLLGSATFIILIFKPLWIIDLGFLLSFSAVLGILIALEISRIHIESKNWLINFGWNSIVVTLGAQFFTLPLILASFGQWYGIGLVTSVLLGVLFSCYIGYGLVLLPFLSLSMLNPYLRQFTDYIYNKMIQMCEYIKEIPFLAIEYKITSWQVILLFVCLIIFYQLKNHRKYVLIPIGVYLLIVILSVKFI